MQENVRMKRIDKEIEREVSTIINNKVEDPNIKGSIVTIHEVKTSPDLLQCTISISAIGKETKKLVDSLNKIKGFIKSELAKSMKLRSLPDLKFIEDTSYEYNLKMAKLFDDIKRK